MKKLSFVLMVFLMAVAIGFGLYAILPTPTSAALPPPCLGREDPNCVAWVTCDGLDCNEPLRPMTIWGGLPPSCSLCWISKDCVIDCLT